MHAWHPLPDTNPEFTVLESPGYREYRVQNTRLLNGSQRKRSALVYLAFIIAVFIIIWHILANVLWVVALVILVVLVTWSMCTQVLHESVFIFPPHGLQIETHRGIASLPLSVRRHFVATTTLHDAIINEGLDGWNVLFYLGVIRYTGPTQYKIDVAFEHLLPPQLVLIEIYNGIHELLSFPYGG